MSVGGFLLILLAVALFLALLMLTTTACMVILHREFDWNPFTTRKQRKSWESTRPNHTTF
ncbi:hypothetical protein [Bifidobacterium vansinderenii]|uniref:Uncharacterized protein n=1 Tax=Bifidobacterium vansinderenii TaxID=1984871 RepID=A0A229VW92_9BIFI|nr:hypothetical protein [Bifidobacterium vansinderenii]OXM99898.1 hypothetical protein Tam10B_1861 [Bifidobacterium vansinderenii]